MRDKQPATSAVLLQFIVRTVLSMNRTAYSKIGGRIMNSEFKSICKELPVANSSYYPDVA